MKPSLNPNDPQMLGFVFRNGRDMNAMITDENIAEVYVESKPFTGWLEKPEFWERIGKDEMGYYLAPKERKKK